jgi:signal transduction histidine kinase
MGQMIDVSTSKRAKISYNLTENLPPFNADAVQMNQVVMNLVMNAAEAIDSDDGIINIATGLRHCSREFLGNTWINDSLPEGEYLFLEVVDNGCGIEPEILPRIFEPFFTTKFTGRGLGMAALLGIIRSHNGAISVKSVPGKGSTFTVFLHPAPEEA